MNSDMAIVWLLIVVALGFVVWRVIRMLRGNGKSCGCGGSCGCHPNLDRKPPLKK
jgi:hypothetical protein